MEENVYKEAVQAFGETHQIIKTIEELSELQQALCKFLDGKKHNVEEEMADVGIMLEQLKLIFNPHMVKGYKYSKIEKLKMTIKEVHENEL